MMDIHHGRRLLTAFFLIVTLGVGLCVYNYSNSERVISLTKHLISVDLPALTGIDDLKIAILRQEPILYEYYATMDGKRFQEAYTANELRIAAGLRLTASTFPKRSELNAIAAHHHAMTILAADLHDTMSNPDGVNWDRARDILASNTREATALNEKLDGLLLSLRNTVQERGQLTEWAMGSISFSVVAFGCGLILFSAMAGYSIRAYLRESRERHRLYLFPLRNPNPILSIDKTGKVRFANPGTEAALSRLGIPAHRHDALLPDDIAERIARLAELNSGDGSEFDYVKSDTVFQCKLSYLREVGITYVYLSDVTESRRAEDAMRKAKEVAEAASVAKSQFLANMSHEIRTPMNGVIGMAELLLESPLDEDQRRLAQTIERSGSALLDIVNDILDISKIEAGKLELETAPFSPAIVAQDCAGMLSEQIRVKGLSLTLNLDPRIPDLIMGDALRFQQVLLNLMGNAVKFTHAGRVNISVHLLRADAREAELRVAVEDTGIGIAPDVQAHIFDAFAQADGSTTRQFGGTGLGLAISRQIVRHMGSELYVESEPGNGARFWFDLHAPVPGVSQLATSPAAPIEEKSTAATRGASTPAERRRRVLLVEDNPVNQLLAKRLLEQLGHEFQVASNGVEAVAMATSGDFDLILMDCQMPEMDGFEATRRIRASGSRGRTIPIVALTANALEGDKGKCLSHGMNDYLSKPFRRHQLAEKLDQWIGTACSELPHPNHRAIEAAHN